MLQHAPHSPTTTTTTPNYLKLHAHCPTTTPLDHAHTAECHVESGLTSEFGLGHGNGQYNGHLLEGVQMANRSAYSSNKTG